MHTSYFFMWLLVRTKARSGSSLLPGGPVTGRPAVDFPAAVFMGVCVKPGTIAPIPIRLAAPLGLIGVDVTGDRLSFAAFCCTTKTTKNNFWQIAFHRFNLYSETYLESQWPWAFKDQTFPAKDIFTIFWTWHTKSPVSTQFLWPMQQFLRQALLYLIFCSNGTL